MKHITIACGWLLAMASFVSAAELQIEATTAATTVFAESESKWSFQIRSDENWSGTAKWRVRHAERTLFSGERAVMAKPDQPGTLMAAFKWPTVKDGVALKVEVVVAADDAEFSQSVWILPKDPFSERREWLRELKLRLLDPDDTLAEKWETLDVPFSRVKSIAGIDDVEDGTLIVSGGPEAKTDDLMQRLVAAAKRGVPVVWFGSASGRFEWPPEDRSINAVQMRRRDVIRELDERLDAGHWTERAAGLKLGARRDAVVAEITDDRAAWSWCEWDFEVAGDNQHQQAKLVWIGWRVAEAWDESPTPRYLLSAVLGRVQKKQSDK